jgi:predicted signal transduction protein with EAL and GGDEF domain
MRGKLSRSNQRFAKAAASTLRAMTADPARRIDTAVEYLPMIDPAARRIVGLRARARGASAPDVAAALRLLRAACYAAAGWPDGFTLTVEVAAAVLRDAAFRRRVPVILGETGLAPERLTLTAGGSPGRDRVLGKAVAAADIADLLRIPSIADAAA